MKAALVAAALLIASVPALAEDLKVEIQRDNDNFTQAFNKGDAAAVARMYTEHANALPPGAPIASGRAAIQTLWQGAIEGGYKNLSLTATSVERYGSAAREIGRFSLDAPDAQKNIVKVEGKYVVIWKHEHDGWMLDTDIWNMNK
jgi:ketosteroid isomerase-like protein